jgi:hypothetical protein
MGGILEAILLVVVVEVARREDIRFQVPLPIITVGRRKRVEAPSHSTRMLMRVVLLQDRVLILVPGKAQVGLMVTMGSCRRYHWPPLGSSRRANLLCKRSRMITDLGSQIMAPPFAGMKMGFECRKMRGTM